MNRPGSCDSCGRWESSTFSPPRWRKRWGKLRFWPRKKPDFHGISWASIGNTCRLLWRLGFCFFFKVSEKNFLLWVVLLAWEMKKSKQDLGLELWAFPRSTRFRKDGWFATTAISGVRNGKSKPYPISHPPVPFPAMHHFWWNDQPLIFSSSHHLFYYKSL